MSYLTYNGKLATIGGKYAILSSSVIPEPCSQTYDIPVVECWGGGGDGSNRTIVGRGGGGKIKISW